MKLIEELLLKKLDMENQTNQTKLVVYLDTYIK